MYRGQKGFLDATVAFIKGGLDLGQPVLVAAIKPRLEVLRGTLGADAGRVFFADMGLLGHNPAGIIPRWRTFVAEHAGPGRPVRGIGEPIWAGRRPAELAECQIHEALLNLAVDPDQPLWLRCPYDADVLPGDVLEEAARSHPILDGEGGYRGSTSYSGIHHARGLFRRPLPEPPLDGELVAFRAGEVADVRERTERVATAAAMERRRARSMAVVAGALAAVCRADGDRGRARIWVDPEAVNCEFTDGGGLDDLLIGRRAGSAGNDGSLDHAVWLASHLCDLVQVRSTWRGITIRILNWR